MVAIGDQTYSQSAESSWASHSPETNPLSNCIGRCLNHGYCCLPPRISWLLTPRIDFPPRIPPPDPTSQKNRPSPSSTPKSLNKTVESSICDSTRAPRSVSQISQVHQVPTRCINTPPFSHLWAFPPFLLHLHPKVRTAARPSAQTHFCYQLASILTTVTTTAQTTLTAHAFSHTLFYYKLILTSTLQDVCLRAYGH